MRVISRVALLVTFVLAVAAPPVFADHLLADCPLTFVGNNPPSTNFNLSPHGVFQFGSEVFVLRGQALTTYNVTALGDMQVAREDFIGTLGARETNGGVTFSNGYLFVSSEAGLEIYDLRGVRPGGTAPLLVSRTPGLHYRRLAVNGNTLAGLYPMTDFPCFPRGDDFCFNQIDLLSIANLSNPVRVGSILSDNTFFVGFNDITFNFGFLIATGYGGTFSFNVSNPGLPSLILADPTQGLFFGSNHSDLLIVGNDSALETFKVDTSGFFSPVFIHTLATLEVNRSNPIIFHPAIWIDDQHGRVISMVDEKDPQTLQPARTFAFDVFDYTVPMYEGNDPRIYEQVSYTKTDEVKHNPVAVGQNVYVIGELSGVQTYGACGIAEGRIEFDSTSALNCGGAEIHGWVTGDQKIANVELFLDNGSLGTSSVGGVPRIDIASKTPVFTWRVNVNLDATSRGEHTLRAVATDSFGNRVQFSSVRVFFNGPGQNCTNRRRLAGLR